MSAYGVKRPGVGTVVQFRVDVCPIGRKMAPAGTIAKIVPEDQYLGGFEAKVQIHDGTTYYVMWDEIRPIHGDDPRPRSKLRRLRRAMRWVAILSESEVDAALRDYVDGRATGIAGASSSLTRWGGGEATVHFGGPYRVIIEAIRIRSAVAAWHSV